MNYPLVSIVIPAYNHATYISEAVNSVLNQTYPNIELIVINDGSTDHTNEILSKLCGRFYYESQPNMGQSLTLKKGWDLAKGEYLSYLSADDILEKDAITELVLALSTNQDCIVVYPDFKLIDPNSKFVRSVKTPDYNHDLMASDVECPIGPGALFKKSAYIKTGPWNTALRQMPDYDFWLRMSQHGHFSRVPKELAGYRVHEGSQTYSVTTIERADEPVRIINDVVYNNNSYDNAIRKIAMANAYLVSAQLHLRAGRIQMAFSAITKSMQQSKRNFFSFRTVRIVINATFNRVFHRLYWLIRA